PWSLGPGQLVDRLGEAGDQARQIEEGIVLGKPDLGGVAEARDDLGAYAVGKGSLFLRVGGEDEAGVAEKDLVEREARPGFGQEVGETPLRLLGDGQAEPEGLLVVLRQQLEEQRDLQIVEPDEGARQLARVDDELLAIEEPELLAVVVDLNAAFAKARRY